jgi:hypothetical protein
LLLKQSELKLGNVIIPIIEKEGEVWFPINLMLERCLGKSLSEKDKREYKEKSKMIPIDYGNKSISDTKCLEFNVCKEFFKSKRFNFYVFTSEQILNYNAIVTYFKLNDLIQQKTKIDKYNIDENKNNYNVNEFTYIKNYIKETNYNGEWVICPKCNKYIPYNEDFFTIDERRKNGLGTYCKCCESQSSSEDFWLSKVNTEAYKIKTKYGQRAFDLHMKGEHEEMVIEIYNEWYDGGKISSIPRIINNKDDIIIIIKYLHKENKINKNTENFSEVLLKEYRLTYNSKKITMDDIYKELYGNEPFEKPWLFASFTLSNCNMKQATKIFNNYLIDNNIKVEDIYDFDYFDTCKKCGLGAFISKKCDILQFVMEFYNNKYPAYKFKIASINYWKLKDNRMQAMKYFIEEDLKVEIDKIPLYITKMQVQRNARTLYTLLHSRKYYNSLYDWINDVYPDRFDRKDFEINAYRYEFDSEEEMLIHELLQKEVGNVIYNTRKDCDPITIEGMQPDWIIPKNNGCYLVEYFGLFVEREENTRIKDYVKRTNDKIQKYSKLISYKFIGLYPQDMSKNMQGIKNKIKNIV